MKIEIWSDNVLYRILAELAEGNAMALFVAGTSTVRVTVEYLIHLMAKYPEIQRKVQAEIDEVTGRSREVTWADSKELVYTAAVIAERHRYFTVAPVGVPRKYVRDRHFFDRNIDFDGGFEFSEGPRSHSNSFPGS